MSRTVPEAVRERLYDRSRSRCERCGLRQVAGLHVSHRTPRGMGGRVEDWSDLSAWNLLCAPCHLRFVETNPQFAIVGGWKVPRWDDPRLVPCDLYWGWAYLTPDGSYAIPPVLRGSPTEASGSRVYPGSRRT